jgi:hypothetical protein
MPLVDLATRFCIERRPIGFGAAFRPSYCSYELWNPFSVGIKDHGCNRGADQERRQLRKM